MFIAEQEVRQHLTYEALIPAIRQALIDYSAGLVEQPSFRRFRPHDNLLAFLASL